MARRYSSEALNITLKHKKKLALEQQRLAEEKRRDEQRKERVLKLELEKQRELKRQQELERQRQREEAARMDAQKKIAKVERQKKSPPVIDMPERVDQIEVRPGENLADIAARREVYEDAMLWPLIYRANRDQIKDPREIFAGQIFVIPRDKTRNDEEAARQEAGELNLF